MTQHDSKQQLLIRGNIPEQSTMQHHVNQVPKVATCLIHDAAPKIQAMLMACCCYR